MAKKKDHNAVPLQVFQGDKMAQLQALYDQWFNCQRCPLSAMRESEEIIFGDGNPNSRILILGEAPGAEEELQLLPFVGASGHVLDQILAAVSDDAGIQDLVKWYAKAARTKDNTKKFHDTILQWREREFFITNVVACRPPENREPSNNESWACWERLYNIIYIVDPIVIIAMGQTALSALMNRTMKITQSRGQLFEIKLPGRVKSVTYPTIAAFHPAYLLRRADWHTKGGDYDKTLEDFAKAMRIVDSYKEKHFGIPLPHRLVG